jgi:hypothetical protein
MRYAIALALASFSVAAIAAEPVNIPLKDIWAYGMPGTNDVRELQTDVNDPSLTPEEQAKRFRESHVEQILATLSTMRVKAKEAFVVEGVGRDALREAYDVLVKNEKRREKFPKDAKLTLVFFSYQFPYYVHLTDVTVNQNVVSIHYKFVPHDTKEVTAHFALIPIGTLPPGPVDVKIIQDPIEGRPSVSSESLERVVCKPFSFRIE